jgi:phage terminase large subunit
MLAPSTLNKDCWPPNYVSVWQWRQSQVVKLKGNPMLIMGAKEYYRTRPAEFINHWVDTYDPRNAGRGTPSRIPLICFERQDDLVDFLMSCIADEEGGLIEKARDMGATWVCAGFSVWLWLFWPGASIGWGSRKEQLVDRLGDADSIFEKMRMIIRGIPKFFLPAGLVEKEHMTYMKFINPANDATITGEAGDNIGRGGRKLIYFKDESAHYERPEKIEAALADNTRVPIDISSVNGMGNVFHRRRENGQEWAPGIEMEKGRTRVFVMDWRDHPAKTQEWYDMRKKKAEADGLLHVFAQEVDRNYSASVLGVVIPADWVEAAVDAHIKLGIPITGGWGAALDVADGGNDRNALAKRHGILLAYAEQWGERDTGVTTRRAVQACKEHGEIALQYDCIGVGSGVKAEANRLGDEKLLPEDMVFVPWNAGAGVLDPDERMIPDDDESPFNKDFFGNLKAQAWWELRLRFYRTFKMVTEGDYYPADMLISLDSRLPLLQTIKKELSQATMTNTGARLKLIIDKAPEGTKSPNLADSIAMAYWPLPADTSPAGFLIPLHLLKKHA